MAELICLLQMTDIYHQHSLLETFKLNEEDQSMLCKFIGFVLCKVAETGGVWVLGKTEGFESHLKRSRYFTYLLICIF